MTQRKLVNKVLKIMDGKLKGTFIYSVPEGKKLVDELAKRIAVFLVDKGLVDIKKI